MLSLISIKLLRVAVNKILTKKYWSETNRLFVSIGRQFTTKKKLEEFLKKEKLLK